jgi:hypothetical protein
MAGNRGVRAGQGKPRLVVLPDGEGRWAERVFVVAGPAVSAGERAVLELAYVGIAVAGPAGRRCVVKDSYGGHPSVRREMRPAKEMAVAARHRGVSADQRESRPVVLPDGEGRRKKRVFVVTGPAVSTGERAVLELAVVGIAVAGPAGRGRAAKDPRGDRRLFRRFRRTVRLAVAGLAFGRLVGASERESRFRVPLEAECGGAERVATVTSQAIRPDRACVRELTLMWIDVAGRAVIRMTTGIGPLEAFRRCLGFAETLMARFTRNRVVRRRERKTRHGVPIAGHGLPLAEKTLIRPRVTVLTGLSRRGIADTRYGDQEAIAVRRPMTRLASSHRRMLFRRLPASGEVSVDPPVRSGLVTVDAGGISMGPVELERRGVLEFGNHVEGPRLPVAGTAVRPKIPPVHVPVAAFALLVESQKALLILRQHVDRGEGVASIAGDLQMFAGQGKIETRMIEALRIVDPRQGKTLPVDHPEIAAVMLGMTLGAVSGGVGRDQTVEPLALRKLAVDLLVAFQAGIPHAAGPLAVARVAAAGADETGQGVRCRNVARRVVLLHQVPERQHGENRQRAYPHRTSIDLWPTLHDPKNTLA